MVTQKKGRGGKAQPAKPTTEEQVPDAEMPESVEGAEENNGDTEQVEEAAAGEAAGEEQEQPEGEQNQETQPEAKAEEEKKEEKVESGKLLVENLPSSFLFDYQEKLKDLFSKHGEVISVKRGPIIVTELTTTPTLSAIVEFKNKESLEKALSEEGTVLDGAAISVAVDWRADTAVLVGVPYEASTDYVRLLFAQCGDVAHIHEFSKTKYKILRVTFQDKEGVEKALKLDRELRINGFLVTVSKYRDEDEQKAHSANANKNKRQHSQHNKSSVPASPGASPGGGARPNNSFRPRGGGGGGGASFNARGNFRGGARGRGGFPARGAAFPRGGFVPPPLSSYMPPQGYMGRPGGFMNDGQRPNKRLRPM